MKTPSGAFFNSRNLRIHFIFCLLVVSFSLKAQKKLHKIIWADDINLIQVNTANCFEVNVNTISGNEIAVEAQIEGEYSKNLDLDVKTSGATIFIEVNFSPSFENPNDKLSAHKVVSILLNITVPLLKDVEIYGTNSRVQAQGKYKGLQVTLADGTCQLHNVSENAKVKTQSGNIIVKAKAAKIQAESRYGKVAFNPIPNGEAHYYLQTVTGNIELSKIE